MTSTTRLVLAGTAAALVAAVSLVGGILRDSGEPARAVAVNVDAASGTFEGGFSADTETFVRQLTADLRQNPKNARGYTLLGLAYQQRARETGNPVFYSNAEQALRKSAELEPRNPETTSALGSLALARHDFAGAYSLGREAVRLAPSTARNYGVLGDALIELGRYDEAFRAFDRMSSLRPDLSSYSRVSYARELLGRRDAARRAMELALDAAGGRPEPTAWVHTQLGKLAWNSGRLGEARAHYRAALTVLPGYVFALEPLALVEEAKGNHRVALSLARRAAEALPLPQTVATLGDLYARRGKPRAAARQYGLVGAIERLLVANGVRTDLETALFDVDHGVRLGRSLELARAAQRARPSIDGDDVLAWALARNGRCDEALVHSRRALRLGTRDALKYFHRGMIERCLGNPLARDWFGRALRLNPHFSLLWSPVAQEVRVVKRLVLLLGLVAALALPAAAQAHPLGNFTVNRYSAIEASGNRVYVKYVLDLAEIPTYQEGDRVRRPGFAGRIARGLELELDGRRVELKTVASRTRSRPGAGGLPTLRFEAVFEGDRAGSTLRFEDTNFAGRIGWREVVVKADRGARIVSSDTPATSVSDELRAYPADLLSEPLNISSASAELRAGSLPGRPPELGDSAPAARPDDGFASLIAQEDLGVGVILVSLGLAFFWGAAHALSPGHGKAIVTAYLVGQRGTPRHAAALGLIVTATHTVGVFALGLVTLALSQFIVPEQLYPWIGLVSGLLVIGVGASVLLSRVRHRRAHRHGHHHHHHHHSEELGWRSLTAVGVSGGLLPCPSALVVLLAAISLHRIGLGLALIVAFSAGLAVSIAGIGLAAILAKRTFARVGLQGRVIGLLPAISALVIVIAGAAMTVRALPKVS